MMNLRNGMTWEQFREEMWNATVGESLGASTETVSAPERARQVDGISKASSSDVIPDFIDTYTRYADVYEMPAEVHEAFAIGLLAATANGNVFIQIGDKTLPLDLWILVTSGSGGGRNTAIRKSRAILEAAGLSKLVRNVSWGSEAVVKQHFAENPRGLYVWSEMSEKLQDFNRSQFAGVKQWITDLYDETTPPSNKIYRRVEGRDNAPSIEFNAAPRTTFMATSSFEWLIQNLTRIDSTGGFLARWLHIHVTSEKKIIPIPKRSDHTLIPGLAARLKQVAGLDGSADLSAVLGTYEKWYRDTVKRFDLQPNQEFAQAYWNRHRDHVLKLAVLFEMSESGTHQVSTRAMDRAIRYAKKVEDGLFKLLPMGFDNRGYVLAQMCDAVSSAGVEGLTVSEFTRRFKNMDPSFRKKCLETLKETNDFYVLKRETGGRPANILVHKDFVEEAKERHPNLA